MFCWDVGIMAVWVSKNGLMKVDRIKKTFYATARQVGRKVSSNVMNLPLAWVIGRRSRRSRVLGLGVGNLHISLLGSIRCYRKVPARKRHTSKQWVQCTGKYGMIKFNRHDVTLSSQI